MGQVSRLVGAVVFFAACGCAGGASASDQPTTVQPVDGIQRLVHRLEEIVQSADAQEYTALLTETADRGKVQDFTAGEFAGGSTRVVIQERDREPLRGAPPGSAFRLTVDVFSEFGNRARAATWRLDVQRVGEPGSDQWAIADQERLSSLENLYKLSINASKQFTARDLRIKAEDLDLTLSEGSVFVVDVDVGVTGLVLLGKGTLSFHPDPVTEKGQVKIFCGNETLDAGLNAAFVRLNPSDFETTVSTSRLHPRAVDPSELKRAEDLFREDSAKSFGVDLGDLSREAWSLLPGSSDFLAEMHTRRYDTLTYTRSTNEAEDISLFDRKRHRNISVYPSKERLAAHGRFYNEDDLVDYDVIDYDIDVSFAPERHWIDGRARIFLKVRAFVLNAITLKLADSLTVQSIVSNELGRVFGLRIKGQNTVIVNLPAPLTRDSTLTLIVTYAGRLDPQAPDRETIGFDGQRIVQEDVPLIVAEPSYLYSSRSFWYPQAVVSDYATARIRLIVPATLDAVASGQLEPGFPVGVTSKDARDAGQPRKLYAFVASQPLRYLAFIVSRFARAETATIGFPDHPAPNVVADVPMAGLSYRTLSLSVEANPRQGNRAHDLAERAADIASYFESVIGDVPYSSFTVALVESDLPGGHSPGYFAALNQPLPASRLTWRNDPASFEHFPEFFLAHEVAHQWWGQAVGWRNYHEQWISEGFAQYFAALYAQHLRGEDAFNGVMRQVRRWGIDESEQGPVYLGYRLGHIRNESRVFRALVYNKGAAVLHMLRMLVGDDAFFAGVRRFYRTMRFKKAGTEDFRAAMEAASGQSLQRFFERWIYGATLPRLKFSYSVDGGAVALRVEQLGDEVFDVPLVVSLQYADRKPVEIVIPVNERTVEKRVPLAGTLRGVDISKDGATLAEIAKS